jgi:hypothetical protein
MIKPKNDRYSGVSCVISHLMCTTPSIVAAATSVKSLNGNEGAAVLFIGCTSGVEKALVTSEGWAVQECSDNDNITMLVERNIFFIFIIFFTVQNYKKEKLLCICPAIFFQKGSYLYKKSIFKR